MLERLLTWSEGEPLDGVLHLPGVGRWPCVIAAHGLLSAKASDKYLLLATHLSQAGFACLRFDFRGCGESGGHLKDSTVTARIRDLKAVLAHLRDHPALDGRFFLLGSSLGGYVALFVAAETPQILASALWATPVHLRDLQSRKDALMAHGLGPVFFQEIAEEICIEVPAGVASCLIIHGEKDELIPPSHARALYERANEPKVLEIMSGADHRFSDRHHREEAVRLSIAWFKKHL